MTPELQHAIDTALQILAYIVFGGGGALAVMRVREGKKSYKELFTEATVASLEQAEELRAAKGKLDDYAALHAQHQRDMDALNGKLELLDKQRAEQEARHTKQMVEQEARHSTEVAQIIARRDSSQQELDRIKQRVEEQARNLKDLEADNTKLRKQQQNCDHLEAERDRIAADLKRAEKRIVELEKLVAMLTNRPDPTPPGNEAKPLTPRKPTDADGAKDATVDLALMPPERKEDAA